MKVSSCLMSVLAFAFLQTASVQAVTWYVTTNGTGDGTSWANPTNSFQGAINASLAGDTVLVSNGVYDTGGTGIDPTNRISITKAITVRSANNDPTKTIIVGNKPNGPSAVRCVFMSGGNVSLTGFTLTNGATKTDARGGGVSGGIVSNCIITGNAASLYGGGAYACYVYNSLLTGNKADAGGGGATYSRLYNCTLSGNSAGAGGGVLDSFLYNCLLTGNSAGEGGGFRFSGVSGGTVNNCTIVGNQASGSGGGVYATASLSMENCIIYFNDAPTAPNWGGTGPVFFTNSCTTTAAVGWVAGNITNDPMFIDKGSGYGTNQSYVAGNYRLATQSPCVNAGINQSWMTNSFDLDGRVRIRYGTVDIGAYERIYKGTIFSIRGR